MQPPRVICVLGMHRSGTSCLAGTLEQGGLLLGDVQTHNAANLRGNRESLRIVALHDAVLQANGFAWDRPPPPDRDLTWSDEQRQEREAIIAAYAGCPRWGFKDPRSLLALNGWRDTLPQMETVGIFRHPLAVAKSLFARGEMPLEHALQLWLAYNRRLLAEWQTTRLPVLSFDGSEEDFRAQVRALGKMLDFPGDLGGGTFYAGELRHSQAEDDAALPAEVAHVYQELRSIAIANLGGSLKVRPTLSILLPQGGSFRTLQSLRPGYQTGVRPGEIELWALGGDAPIAELGASFAICREERARGERVAILTDRNALLSPGLLGLAARLEPNAVLVAPAYECDEIKLAQIGWPHATGSGERLFDASHPAKSPDEYSFVALSREVFERAGRDVQHLARLKDVRWLLAAAEGTFHFAVERPSVSLPGQVFDLHGSATHGARNLFGTSTDLPLDLGDGTIVTQLKAKNNELRARIETLKQKNAELRARGDKWKEKAGRKER